MAIVSFVQYHYVKYKFFLSDQEFLVLLIELNICMIHTLSHTRQKYYNIKSSSNLMSESLYYLLLSEYLQQ